MFLLFSDVFGNTVLSDTDIQKSTLIFHYEQSFDLRCVHFVVGLVKGGTLFGLQEKWVQI